MQKVLGHAGKHGRWTVWSDQSGYMDCRHKYDKVAFLSSVRIKIILVLLKSLNRETQTHFQ